MTGSVTQVPLVWAESNDEWRNSRFEALSHLAPPAADGTFAEFWIVFPRLEENRLCWRLDFTSEIATPDVVLALLKTGCFETADDARAACEQMEIELGGAARAPRMPVADPDQSPPLVTDDHGFAPTRIIRSRWSRRDGQLYLYRVWAKPEDQEQTIEKKLEGEEYAAALPAYIRQRMVESLVASITTPGGWIVPLVWTTPALGQVRLECEVHFAAVRGLHWAKDFQYGMLAEKATFVELEAPSHRMICSIVGEELTRKKAEWEKTLAGTTTEQLQREIARNARALGINSPMPEPDQETGHVLPATLEHLQAAGMDLRGDGLKT